jgi:hypothetical protein
MVSCLVTVPVRVLLPHHVVQRKGVCLQPVPLVGDLGRFPGQGDPRLDCLSTRDPSSDCRGRLPAAGQQQVQFKAR